MTTSTTERPWLSVTFTVADKPIPAIDRRFDIVGWELRGIGDFCPYHVPPRQFTRSLPSVVVDDRDPIRRAESAGRTCLDCERHL